MKVSTEFEVDTTIRCLVIALLLLIRYVTLTFWPWSVVTHGGSRGQSLHQVWISYGIRSWVMRSDISHRIPLTMCLQPLRTRRHITWPICRGKFFPHIWNLWPRFAYSLYNFYGATTTFKGCLLLVPPMLKLFFGWKFVSTKSGLKLAFLRKKGV